MTGDFYDNILTTITLHLPKFSFERILHPESAASALPRHLIAEPVPRTRQMTNFNVRRKKYSESKFKTTKTAKCVSLEYRYLQTGFDSYDSHKHPAEGYTTHLSYQPLESGIY